MVRAKRTVRKNPLRVMLAKTIGVLNLISRNEGLKASEGILRQLFTTRRAFHEAIQPLLNASVVQYRRFSGEYRVWQGTDFDIDERTDEEKDKLGEFDLAAPSATAQPPRPYLLAATPFVQVPFGISVSPSSMAVPRRSPQRRKRTIRALCSSLPKIKQTKPFFTD